jgi:disulfide bond formation protein DsbB
MNAPESVRDLPQSERTPDLPSALMRTLSRLAAAPAGVAGVLGLVCTALVGASFYVQHVLGIEPCPLCIVQRFTYIALVPVFLAAAIAPADGRSQRSLLWAAGTLALGGLAIAGYQTYLQLFPAPVAARCSASLSYMLDSMAFTEVLARLVQATGDCSDTSFRILGLTLAQASLLVFLSFTLSLAILLRRKAAPA